MVEITEQPSDAPEEQPKTTSVGTVKTVESTDAGWTEMILLFILVAVIAGGVYMWHSYKPSRDEIEYIHQKRDALRRRPPTVSSREVKHMSSW
jgi:hypothetical protein